MECPDCKGTLKGGGYSYSCESCGKSWKVDFVCETCYNTPELIDSCGSSTFFCKTCKRVKSRESMDKSLTRA
jgi:hypothetical protein